MMNSHGVEAEMERVVLRGEGKALRMMGEEVYIRLSGEDTGGAYSIIEDVTPPLAGPPLHVHTREDETFYVLAGEYELRVGDSTFKATPGTYVFAPRGVPHTFQNISKEAGRLMIVFSPPGFEKFFEDVDAAERAGSASFERIVALAGEYGNHAI